jgi:hypothetical protein
VEPNRLPVIAVKHVNERYHAGMFGDFEETVTNHIARLKTVESWQNSEKIRFFEHLLNTVDRERYRALRDSYLSPPRIVSSALKYLDPVSWFEQKFGYVFRLGLHEKAPMRILDIGTGPGHFMVIANFYGHTTVGTDIPDHEVDGPTHLYNGLADIYGTTRIKNRITPFKPLTELGGSYDLVTAFSAAFNLARGGVLWEQPAWDYFLSSLRKDVLVDDGEFFLMLVKLKTRDDIWDYLASLAKWSDEPAFLLRMDASALPDPQPARAAG